MINRNRDSLILSLFRSNHRRAAWPIFAVLPLLRKLGAEISYEDFISLIAKMRVDDSVKEDAKKLKRVMFEKDVDRKPCTAWEHYCGRDGDPS